MVELFGGPTHFCVIAGIYNIPILVIDESVLQKKSKGFPTTTTTIHRDTNVHDPSVRLNQFVLCTNYGTMSTMSLLQVNKALLLKEPPLVVGFDGSAHYYAYRRRPPPPHHHDHASTGSDNIPHSLRPMTGWLKDPFPKPRHLSLHHRTQNLLSHDGCELIDVFYDLRNAEVAAQHQPGAGSKRAACPSSSGGKTPCVRSS